jgi:hypothetical protein
MRQHRHRICPNQRTAHLRKQTPTDNNGEKMNLLDVIAATEAKEKAIATVATNTNPDWWQACYNTIATTTNTFTTDDIWQALEDQSLPTPHEPRAMGAVLRHAAANGLIRATDTYRPSARVACHARPIRVWERV